MRPCQELADDLGFALPAFGLLERDVLTGKRGPAADKSPRLARREAPACRKARTLGFALFGAPSPLTPRGELIKPRTLIASRQGARMPASLASPRRKPGSSSLLSRFAQLDSGLRRNDVAI